MIRFAEYKLKKQNINKQVLDILSNDSNDGTLYTLHMRNRETKLNLDCGVFRHYSNLKDAIDGYVEFEEHANDENYSAADFEWFDISKYIMSDGEYKQQMNVKITFGYGLIHYYIEDSIIEEKALLEQNVETPYETGDIIKIKNMPLSEDFYGIYIYDENQEDNKHIQMTFNGKADFSKIYWLERTEKAMHCVDERLNDISRQIKAMNGDFSKVFQKYGIKMNIQPF